MVQDSCASYSLLKESSILLSLEKVGSWYGSGIVPMDDESIFGKITLGLFRNKEIEEGGAN
jgi:hypothetical protein